MSWASEEALVAWRPCAPLCVAWCVIALLLERFAGGRAESVVVDEFVDIVKYQESTFRGTEQTSMK
jgi:hypothetical protein